MRLSVRLVKTQIIIPIDWMSQLTVGVGSSSHHKSEKYRREILIFNGTLCTIYEGGGGGGLQRVWAKRENIIEVSVQTPRESLLNPLLKFCFINIRVC